MTQARRPPRRHWLLAGLAVLVVLAAFLLPPLVNISRYQHQIAAGLSRSLGHPVEISGVKLHMLPRPGVDIAYFAVDSTSGYSAEPILQCSSVSAAFRIVSLWRGRLEVARISLDEPSLNLERAPDGQWNFASVVTEASRAQQAPTGQAGGRGEIRFPYIEATGARINFKHGNEKLPFSFLNADVSVWLDNPNEWQLRFAAQPMRTDLNLSAADTGQVQITGSVHRVPSASQLPLDLHATWQGAPLGQVTRMLLAEDLGWRGETSIDAYITGVPDALGLNFNATAEDFHRESFQPARALNLHITCTATYRHTAGAIDGIRCLSPVGSGRLALSGSWQSLHTAKPEPNLMLAAAQVPAESALDLLRHTRGRLDNTLTLSGTLDGALRYTQPAAAALPIAAGSLSATDLLLRGNGFEQLLPDLRFSVQPVHPLTLVLEPARVDLGGAEPLLAEARLTREGYKLHYSGAALLERLLPLAHAFRVAPAAFEGLQGDGAADYNLTVEGDWLQPLVDGEPAPSTLHGAIGLHNAAFQPSYLAEPVHITTVTATVSPDELRWNGINATFGSTHFAGTLRIPVPCTVDCRRSFDLSAATVNLGAIAASLRGADQGVMLELIDRVRTRSHTWPALEGTLHTARLVLGPLEIANAAANLSLDDGRLTLQTFDGRALGGAVHASGSADLRATPNYDLRMRVLRASAPALAQLLDERWGPGMLDLDSSLRMSGSSAADLSSSARGTLAWTWTGGALPALSSTPLRRFDRWTGAGHAARGTITITNSEVVSGAAATPVSGAITRDRALDLKVGNAAEDSVETVTGTLAAPTVEAR